VTIAFGVACEDGVLLATDSLSQLHRPNGWIDCKFGRKIDRFSNRAYVVSGSKPDQWAPAPEWDSLSLVDLAINMIGELAQFADGRQPQHLLIGDSGGLVLVGTDVDLVEAKPGGPLVGGAMRDWVHSVGADFGPLPRMLEDAIPFVIESCRRYVHEQSRAWGFEKFEDFNIGKPGGFVPPFAPPFQLAVITNTEIQTMEFA
jgi:hypothetical protein